MKRGIGTKAQLELSFGMIFSIILIIVFIVFAGYAIMKIIRLQENVSTLKFVNDLQNDVNSMWQANTAGSQGYTYKLPVKVEQVCIDENSEISFLPFGVGENAEDTKIEHLSNQEKFCIETTGEIKIRISKGKYDSLVSIEEDLE